MKKIGIICLIIMVALGAIGVGYSAWSQNLVATGNVNTGSYSVNFSSPTPSPTPTTATAWVTLDSNTATTFTFTIHNGYPGFTGQVTYSINNTGSVPAIINSIALTGTGATITGTGPWNVQLPSGTTTDVVVTNSGINVNDTLAATSGTEAGTLTVEIPSTLTTDAQGLTGTLTLTIGTQQNPS